MIDLDVDKDTGETVGEDTLRGMRRYAHLVESATVRTPSGGRHIYFQNFDGARNTTGKIGPKIDTRGAGGYVIAPGSETAAGIYMGGVPKDRQEVPVGLRAMLLRKPAPARCAQDRLPPSSDEVRELLGHIPPDSAYDDCVAVLMALHDRYGGSDEGLALADQWSATGSKYRPGEVAAKWRGFKRSGVSWATIPALARQNGANLSEIARRHS